MIPNHISTRVVKRLMSEEKILASATESKSKNTGTPNSIIATNKRLMVYNPAKNGSTQPFRDFQYSMILEIEHKTERGFSQLRLDTRSGQDFLFEKLEKSEAHNVADAVQNMRLNSGVDASQTTKEIAA